MTALAALLLVQALVLGDAAPAVAPKAEMPLGFSLMPPDMDLVPPAKKVKCSKNMLKFEPDAVPFDVDVWIPYEGEDGTKLRWKLRPGVLMSECGFVHTLNIAIEHKQLRIEVDSLHSLLSIRSQGWETAEIEYQTTIITLQGDLRKANQPSFWEEIDGTVGIVVGAVLGIATGVALVFGGIELVKALNQQMIVVQQ